MPKFSLSACLARRMPTNLRRPAWVTVAPAVLCLVCLGVMIVACMSPAGEGTATPPGVTRPTDAAEPTIAPTESPVATDTPVPAPTMVSAEPPSLQGVTDYVDGKGVLHVVGEVVNHSGQNINSVEITASFYDSSGQLVTTESGSSSLHIVETGGLSPFVVMLPDSPDSIATYDLDLGWAETAEQPLAVEVVNHTGWVDAARLYHVDGEVRNPHDFAVKSVEVIGTFYDGAGEVVRVESAFKIPDVLDAGQTSKFGIVLLSTPGSLERYELQTQAVKK